jgi:hypothetical protein
MARLTVITVVAVAALALWASPGPASSAFAPTTVDQVFAGHAKLAPCDADVRAQGAVGDGVTDDTAAIQRAIDLTPPGATLCIPDGAYLIDAVRSLALKSRLRLKLASGARLKAAPTAQGGYAVVKIWDREDVVVEGGTIEGERARHQGTTGEWGMGIDIRGARKVTLRSVRITDCWGDAIYLGRGKASITNEAIDILDVTATNNRRQGISIITGKSVAIVRTLLAETNGTPPAAGLDIEPNKADEPIEDIRIIDLTTRKNQGAGVTIGLGVHRPENRSTIEVYQHTDIGSGRPFVLSATTTTGAVRIERASWQGSGERAVIQRHCRFTLTASGLSPALPAPMLTNCVR